MHDSVLSLQVFGLTVYAYGAAIALGVLVALIPMYFSLRRQGEQKRLLPMALWMAPLGLIGGRLLYCLCIAEELILAQDLGFVFRLSDGGYLLYGVMGGSVLGLMIYAKLGKISFAKLANAAAPAAALMIAIARSAECMTAAGVGWPVENESLQFFPLAVVNEWEEWHYAIFVLEALVALGLFLYLNHLERKGRKTAMPFIIVYASMQLLMESLRKDDVLTFGFVKVSMILSALILTAVVISFIIRRVKGAWWSLAGLAAGCGLVTALEFALDKSSIPNEIVYAMMLVAVVLICVLMLRWNDRAQVRQEPPSAAA